MSVRILVPFLGLIENLLRGGNLLCKGGLQAAIEVYQGFDKFR